MVKHSQGTSPTHLTSTWVKTLLLKSRHLQVSELRGEIETLQLANTEAGQALLHKDNEQHALSEKLAKSEADTLFLAEGLGASSESVTACMGRVVGTMNWGHPIAGCSPGSEMRGLRGCEAEELAAGKPGGEYDRRDPDPAAPAAAFFCDM